ncbi:MAG: hypothetical protein AAF533_30870 [Acidobacteriota bacterium]
MLIELIDGSDPAVDVVVEGTGFSGMVDIEVALVPESGSGSIVAATIDMTGGDPATVTVPVTLPTNSVTKVSAWRVR